MKTLETSEISETPEKVEERVVSPEDFHLPENNSLGITQFAEQLGMKAPVLSNIIKKALIVEKDYFNNDYGGIRIIHFKPTGSKKLAIAISERNKATKKIPLIKTQTTEQVQENIEGVFLADLGNILPIFNKVSPRAYWNQCIYTHSNWFIQRSRTNKYVLVWMLRTEHIKSFIEGFKEYSSRINASMMEREITSQKKI